MFSAERLNRSGTTHNLNKKLFKELAREVAVDMRKPSQQHVLDINSLRPFKIKSRQMGLGKKSGSLAHQQLSTQEASSSANLMRAETRHHLNESHTYSGTLEMTNNTLAKSQSLTRETSNKVAITGRLQKSMNSNAKSRMVLHLKGMQTSPNVRPASYANRQNLDNSQIINGDEGVKSSVSAMSAIGSSTHHGTKSGTASAHKPYANNGLAAANLNLLPGNYSSKDSSKTFTSLAKGAAAAGSKKLNDAQYSKEKRVAVHPWHNSMMTAASDATPSQIADAKAPAFTTGVASEAASSADVYGAGQQPLTERTRELDSEHIAIIERNPEKQQQTMNNFGSFDSLPSLNDRGRQQGKFKQRDPYSGVFGSKGRQSESLRSQSRLNGLEHNFYENMALIQAADEMVAQSQRRKPNQADLVQQQYSGEINTQMVSLFSHDKSMVTPIRSITEMESKEPPVIDKSDKKQQFNKLSRQSLKKSRNEKPSVKHGKSLFSPELLRQNSMLSSGSDGISQTLLSETAQFYQQSDPYAQTFAQNPLQSLVRKSRVDSSIEDSFKKNSKLSGGGVQHLNSTDSRALRAQGRSQLEAYQSQSVALQAYKDLQAGAIDSQFATAKKLRNSQSQRSLPEIRDSSRGKESAVLQENAARVSSERSAYFDRSLRKMAMKLGMKNVYNDGANVLRKDEWLDFGKDDFDPNDVIKPVLNPFGAKQGKKEERASKKPMDPALKEAIERGESIYKSKRYVDQKTLLNLEGNDQIGAVAHWDQTKQSHKRDIRVRQMANRMNDVSRNIFRSYVTEIEDLRKAEPKTFEQFKLELGHYLNFRHPDKDDEVYAFFARQAVRDAKERSYENMKRRFGDPAVKPTQGKEKVNYDQFQFSEADFVDASQSVKLDLTKALAKVDDKDVMTNIDTHETTGELTLEQIQEQLLIREKRQKQKTFQNMRAQYEELKARELAEVVRDNEVAARKELLMLEPERAVDENELVDQNLDELLMSSDAFKQAMFGRKKRTEMLRIKESAAEITEALRSRANDVAIKQMNLLKFKHMLAGNKTEYLVYKFISKLRETVASTKLQAEQRQNEKIVAKLIEKSSYNAQFARKKAEPTSRDRKKRIVELQSPSRKQNVIKSDADLIRVEDYLKDAHKHAEISTELNHDVVPVLNLEEATHIINKQFGSSRSSIGRSNRAKSKSSSPSEEDSDADYEQGQLLRQRVKKNVLREYIHDTQSTGVPLPILTMIKSDGLLPLVNYQLNGENQASVVRVLPKITPSQLKKLYLINNMLKEREVAAIFEKLSVCEPGLITLAMMQNAMGPSAFKALSQQLLPSRSVKALKKLVVKDPTPFKLSAIDMRGVCSSLLDSSRRLSKLTRLTLCRLGIDRHGLTALGQAVPALSSLFYLDISGNSIESRQLSQFLNVLTESKSRLRFLNIAYNAGTKENIRDHGQKFAALVVQKKPEEKIIDESRLEVALAKYLHASRCLLHLDISGMSMPIDSYIYLAENGLRKSHTLLVVHMGGAVLLDHQLIQMRRAMNVRNVAANRQLVEDNQLAEIAYANKRIFNRIFSTKIVDGAQQILANAQTKQSVTALHRALDLTKQPVLASNEGDRIAYQRILGHPEIVGSHSWQEINIKDCLMCAKATYCIITWNKRLAQKGLNLQFFGHSPQELLRKKYQSKKESGAPILFMRDTAYRMITLREMLERINYKYLVQANQVRACNNELEKQHFDTMRHLMAMKIEDSGGYDSSWTGWDVIKNSIDDEEVRAQVECDPQAMLGLGTSWVQNILRYVPKDSFEAVDLNKYAKHIQIEYRAKDFESELDRLNAIVDETYMMMEYVPDACIVSQGKLECVIKHNEIDGVDFLRVEVPRCKHLSVNTTSVLKKQIKKVKEIRRFSKPNSVFAQWRHDTQNVIDKAFETDRDLTKLKKFIKDEDDLNKTYQIFRKCYGELKNQFNTQIASGSYPVIDWLDFVDMCQKTWRVVDGSSLTSQDIDRIFLATNFEEQDLEENDDNSLCRFEFMEIIARLAREKYQQKGTETTIWASCKRLLDQFILPNTCEIMEWQGFRDKELWTLAVDDLLKANLIGIQELYKKYATNAKKLSKEDMYKMFEHADATADPVKLGLPADFIDPVNKEVEKNLILAYSLSKMTIGDEMADFDNYNRMLLVEFYEFIGRLAHLLFIRHEGSSQPLCWKVEQLLRLLLPLLPKPFTPVGENDNLDSDSDYDDDLVEHIVKELIE